MEESTMKKRLFALGALSVLAVVAAFVAQPGARAATTPSCSSTAPAGTQYVGTATVDSSSSTGTSLQLPANGTYTAVACGFWMNGLYGQYGSADAAYNSNASWTTTPQQGGDQNGGPEWGKLQINGTTPNWGAYSAAHTYTAQFTGASASFLINDTPVDSPWFTGWWGDNSGSLTVDVYRVNTYPTSATECKNNGWKAYGVFKNQGDCVSFVATGAKNTPAGA
jgi:hypothetical protein